LNNSLAAAALAVMMFLAVMPLSQGVVGNDLVSETLSILDLLQKQGIDVTVFRKVLNDVVQAADTKGATPITLSPESTQIVKDINRIGRKALKAVEVDLEKTRKALEIISTTYVYRTLNNPVSSTILDAARQLAESALDNVKEDGAEGLLKSSEILLEGFNSITGGGKLSLRIIRSETGEAETTIATIPTSKDVVRVYLSEEKTRAADNSVVTIRKAFINLGKTIIIQKETISNIQPAEDQNKEVHLGYNTALGAVIELREESTNRITLDKTEYDVAVKEFTFEQNSLRLLLSSNTSQSGRIIILDVDRGIARKYMQTEIAVKVDGKPAKLVDSVADMLSGKLDTPAYFLAITGKGLQIVLYIPHWSDKLVVIGPSTALSFQISVPGTLGAETQVWATTLAAVLLASSLLVRRFRERK
jgi:hypothetical protein